MRGKKTSKNDAKKFARTANKTNKLNKPKLLPRGGTRL